MHYQLQQTVNARYHELDPRNWVRLTVILAWLQEVGAEHALQLGVGLKHLHKMGLTWVLSRLTIELLRPVIGTEQVTVSTWPVTRDGFFSIRDFLLTDQQGQTIGRATSSWAALDLKTRRPVKIDEHLSNYPLHLQRALNDPFATLPLLEGCQTGLQLPVLRADLDMNNHVNNTIYAGWALEAVPEELIKRAVPVLIEIGFRAEALYGDSIQSCCVPSPEDPAILIHRIESTQDNRELCRLRTTWKNLDL
ncbi:MAG: thioesterase [Trichlorobacter sp.]|uniref:acyl-[acyl-carrier-protein] thioesterase n=1 Tax=Trichlorobacter sp. TaxID=2911007 RepID=UPI00256E4A4C|nr:acyl-ACP thioesterase domain-containing protein [Trichlorobacter sp.]MDK9717850.1 thioesterase [Trichlorobacter sp.]